MFASPLCGDLLSPGRGFLPFQDDTVVANLSNCRYFLVHKAAEANLFMISRDEEDQDFTLFWMDKSSLTTRIQKLKNFQVINHFPRAHYLSKRTDFARYYNRLCEKNPIFDFVPEVHELPGTLQARRLVTKMDQECQWILKPCRKDPYCKNISVVNRRDVQRAILENGEQRSVIQKYIGNPLLLEGKKFDLRIFILVTSLRPLTIFMFKSGFVRIAGENFEPESPRGGFRNLRHSIHITSPPKQYFQQTFPDFKPEVYRLNVTKIEDSEKEWRRIENMEKDPDDEPYSTGRFRDFKFFSKWVEEQENTPGYTELMSTIGEMLVKTVLVGYPRMLEAYKKATDEGGSGKEGSSYSCFEIFGVDVLIDENWKPWLLDISHSPSYIANCELDREVKYDLLTQTLKLISLNGDEKERTKEYFLKEREKKLKAELYHRKDDGGGFTRIFPTREFILSHKEFLDEYGVEYDMMHSLRYLEIKDHQERIASVMDMVNEDRYEQDEDEGEVSEEGGVGDTTILNFEKGIVGKMKLRKWMLML